MNASPTSDHEAATDTVAALTLALARHRHLLKPSQVIDEDSNGTATVPRLADAFGHVEIGERDWLAYGVDAGTYPSRFPDELQAAIAKAVARITDPDQRVRWLACAVTDFVRYSVEAAYRAEMIRLLFADAGDLLAELRDEDGNIPLASSPARRATWEERLETAARAETWAKP